jgi:hypothetical protein
MMIRDRSIADAYRDLRTRGVIGKIECRMSDTRALALGMISALGTSGELVQFARADEQKLYQRAIELALAAGWAWTRSR